MQTAMFCSVFRGGFSGLLLVGLVFLSSGCISQKPLPYAVIPENLAASGPALTIVPVVDKRGVTNELDSVLRIPECVEEVLASEMEGLGMFQSVARTSASGATGESGYRLAVTLDRLEWEIPGHDRIVGTAFGLSLATGGIGGLIYGSTGTEVLGHAALTVRLTSEGRVILEKSYTGTAQEKKAKMKSDTPATGRELAAKAVASAIGQLKADLVATQSEATVKVSKN